MHKSIPIVGIVAAGSNAGKTTLITKLIVEFKSRNIRVSVIKHAHHVFDIDHKGKDSYNIREAGAVQTLIASNQRWALMTEIASEPNLQELIAQLNPNYADLILVEGFKQAAISIKKIFAEKINRNVKWKVIVIVIVIVIVMITMIMMIYQNVRFRD